VLWKARYQLLARWNLKKCRAKHYEPEERNAGLKFTAAMGKGNEH
jgi:hypothetical protein